MKVFLTGGTGFIGASLVRGLLTSGHQVRLLRRAQSNLRQLGGLPVETVVGAVEDRD